MLALLAIVFVAAGIAVDPRSTGPAAAALRPSTTQARFIPGLTGADIKLNVQKRGFACSASSGTGQSWLCQRSSSTSSESVTYSGPGPTQIQYVSATELQFTAQPSDDIAVNFLGYLATLPYEGASPAAAQAWVTKHLLEAPDVVGTHAETTFGGAHFEITGARHARLFFPRS